MVEEDKINEETNKKSKKKNIVNETIKKDNDSAKVYLKSIKVSPKKLNIIISPIRGLIVEKALNYLSFSQKRISYQIKKALQSAIANAENNHQLDVDKLYVHEASVGKGLVMKRFKPRAKGRGARILKHFSNLTIKLKEQVETQIEKKNKIKKSLVYYKKMENFTLVEGEFRSLLRNGMERVIGKISKKQKMFCSCLRSNRR